MFLLIFGIFSGLLAGVAALHFMAQLRMTRARRDAREPVRETGHYLPMLRLLDAQDGNNAAQRAERRRIFREYLRNLTEDYGRVLAGIRLAMVESDVDRPDLARVLWQSRLQFTLEIWRIDVRLRLHALGIGHSELPGLLEALGGLRVQTAMLADSVAWGS